MEDDFKGFGDFVLGLITTDVEKRTTIPNAIKNWKFFLKIDKEEIEEKEEKTNEAIKKLTKSHDIEKKKKKNTRQE